MASLMDYFRRGGPQYTPLSTDEVPNGALDDASDGPPTHQGPAHQQQAVDRRQRTRRIVKVTAVALMLVMVGYLAVAFSKSGNSGPRQCDTPERGFQCSTPMSHTWGQYSPYFSVPSEIDPSIPKGCELTFAQVLSRHGARAPTFFKAASYVNLIDRIHDATVSYSPGFSFLKSYTYTLGADQLTPMGQQQMVNSGLKFYRRYHSLARESVPFIRAGGQDRVVHSGENFTQGFHSALLADRQATIRPKFPYDMLIIPETATTNNTLHHGLCTAFEKGPYASIGRSAQATYLSAFAPPITARLNSNLPGAKLTDADTISLMDLCPFETVAASPSGDDLAPFCHLFSPREWQAYDYYQSLGKWYGFGPGNPLGPTQGVGFVNELLARLLREPVTDNTCTNRTLDGDDTTFPLDRALYADFSHDNDMTGVLGALGVYDGVGMLDNGTRQEPEEVGGFSAGWAVPFAARVYVEKMRCGSGEEMVRVLVNDRVMPLKGCGADERGMCRLRRFVESMEFARGNGKWDLCFV
ncbi:histidine phosphatase superfamily [Chaetomidium leptoderma]|uniref:Phytase A n=1 Tax=Chaetomidium leptoderma TaxID=669021 RepID=A0AAN6VVJ2_9PEZI|nr:histidine phosphatase superfamily [Chaetomidium leptoderma]